MKLLFKIRAGALQFVVFIGVIIAILLAAFVTLVYVNTKFSKQTTLLVDSIELANNGIIGSLSTEFPYRDTINLKTEASELSELKLYKSFWGIYETATTVSTIKKNRIVNHAFIGTRNKLQDRIGLYLAEDNQPLVVVGNALISGNNYIPKQGVKAGTISGVSYYRNQLIYGSSNESAERLPELSPNIKSEILRLQGILDATDTDAVTLFNGITSMKISFNDDLGILYNSETIDLDNSELTGQIIVYSDTKISVKASSKLIDVILVAPKIEIQSNFKGNFQAIASENIMVGENALLKYPSALILYNESVNSSEDNQRDLVLSKNATIQGQVIVNLPDDERTRFEPQLKLHINSKINGEAYSNQNVEHLGTINGSLFAKRFIAKQAGSVYINHIFNGRIDAKALSSDYIGLNFKSAATKNIMKWGY